MGFVTLIWTIFLIPAFWAHSMSRDSELKVFHQRLNRRFQAAMIKVMKSNIEDFDMKAIKGIAMFIIGTIEGLALQHVLDPKSFNPEEAAEMLKVFISRIFFTK